MARHYDGHHAGGIDEAQMSKRHGESSQHPAIRKKAERTAAGRPAQVEQHVGEAIRRLRKGQRLSLRALASKCGFSASFMSQVELGQASPSVASLERIASGLEITLGQFFLAVDRPQPAVIKAAHRAMLESQWSRAHIEAVSPPRMGSKLEALLITLRAGGTSGARLHVEAQEVLAMVLSGTVYLHLQDSTQPLRRGDAITIPPETAHRWENKAAKPAQLLKVSVRMVL